MSVDRLSDMLSSIKNASMTGKQEVEIMYSKECESAAKVLKDAGFLSEVKVFKVKDKVFKGLHLELAKTEDGEMAITEVKRVSKPGRRLYTTYAEIGKKKLSRGVTVVSTSRGIMNSQEAQKRKLGGEVLCRVY